MARHTLVPRIHDPSTSRRPLYQQSIPRTRFPAFLLCELHQRSAAWVGVAVVGVGGVGDVFAFGAGLVVAEGAGEGGWRGFGGSGGGSGFRDGEESSAVDIGTCRVRRSWFPDFFSKYFWRGGGGIGRCLASGGG